MTAHPLSGFSSASLDERAPRLVSIGNGAISMHLALRKHGMPELLAFGPFPIVEAPGMPLERASRVNGMDIAVPSAVLLPTGGMGFFGWPAIAGHREGRDFIAEFAGWSVEGDDRKLMLRAADPVAKLDISIGIEAFGQGVIAMCSTLTNMGGETYTLDGMLAGTMLAAGGTAEITSFSGMWGREFHARSERLGRALWLQENRRGRTSHDRFPGLVITAAGIAYGIHLGWSGNHLLSVDTLDDGRRLIHAGELFEPGEMRLAPGESYESPVAYLSAAATADGVCERLRNFVSAQLVGWPEARPRPVTLNTWEGNYFDHRLDRLKAQAEAAAALGVERFVLDDGWFGRRNDDTSSLGDWTVDQRKYPDGLKPLADHVQALGMEFGLWFEPEMVNPDSDLYRQHPDWVLQAPGRPLLPSRNQLVLDLTRPEVSEHLFAAMDALLSSLPIAYIKWDMNRDLTHVGDARGRAATGRQVRAVYALLDRIRDAHPHVEIESCASGGGRADYGVLARTHRIWTSDCTDALDRLEIQRGATMFFPPHILGAHVSASPNHQTHRRHTLSFRAVVALAYHFGVELDPCAMEAGERAELAGWITLHKRLRPLLHAGRFFQDEPHDGRYVWGAEAEDQIVLFVAQARQMLAEQPLPLRLEPRKARRGRWRIAAVHPSKPDFIRMSEDQRRLLSGETAFSLDALRHGGLPLPMLRPESGFILEIEPVQ